jgi:hypothetical protein
MIHTFETFINEKYDKIKVTLSGDETKTMTFAIDDIALGGRFKNKKIKIKNIDSNDKGDVTINGKPFLKFREFTQKSE